MRRLLCVFLLVAAILLLIILPVAAQDILLDDFVRAGGLILFRSYSEPLNYYYVPNQPSLAMSEDGKPEFSFVKYVRNVPGEASHKGIQQASGGGVVHFLVTYEVPQSVIDEAAQELQEKTKNAQIAGPVLFRSGRFALVTSIAAEGGKFANKVVGLGKAPLIEGAKAAVSVDLNPEGASLLWESFKMDNPDISIVFDMEIEGFRNPYDATMEVDWDQVYRDEKVSAGAKFFWIGGDLEGVFTRLEQNGAVKLETKGENASMDAIIQRAHAKLLDMMFAPVKPPAEKKSQGTDPFAAVAALLGKGGAGGKSKPSPISLYGSYKLKDIKRSGKAKFDFNHHAGDRLNTVMAGNIGNLHSEYGEDPGLFRATNLDDPVFKQREISVHFDAKSGKDFAEYINFVTVQIRKQHASGEESIDEVLINEDSVKREKNRFRMVYGWKGDADRTEWLHYEYRTVWNFRQGIQVEGDWQRTNNFVIGVTPPYEYRRVSLEATPETFKEREVRHAVVKFYYLFFGKEIERQANVRVKGNVALTRLDYICESGNYDYEYEITWYLRGGEKLKSGRLRDFSDILYVDDLPEAAKPGGSAPSGG